MFCLTSLDSEPAELRNSHNSFPCPVTEIRTPKHGSPVRTVPTPYPSLNRNVGKLVTMGYGVTSENMVLVWFWNIFRAKKCLKRCARHGVYLCRVWRHKTRAPRRPALWLIVRMRQDGRVRHVYMSLYHRLRIEIDVNNSSSLRFDRRLRFLVHKLYTSSQMTATSCWFKRSLFFLLNCQVETEGELSVWVSVMWGVTSFSVVEIFWYWGGASCLRINLLATDFFFKF